MCENCAKLEKKVEALKEFILEKAGFITGSSSCPANFGMKNHEECSKNVALLFCRETCWPEALGKFLEDVLC